MSVIIVTGALREQLLNLTERAELRDEAGILIGRFESPILEAPELHLTEAELPRRTPRPTPPKKCLPTSKD